MTRSELYLKIKAMNLAEEVKKTFGDNYTRVSSKNLEALIAKYSVKKTGAKSKAKKVIEAPLDVEKAIVRLVSTLLAGCVIGKVDADFILLGK